MAEKNANRFSTMPEILKEYEQLEKDMADPSIHADQGKARQLGKRYAQLGPVIAGYRAFKKSEEDLTAARELAEVEPDFAAEIPALEKAYEDCFVDVTKKIDRPPVAIIKDSQKYLSSPMTIKYFSSCLSISLIVVPFFNTTFAISHSKSNISIIC
jgi:hypothetical protein